MKISLELYQIILRFTLFFFPFILIGVLLGWEKKYIDLFILLVSPGCFLGAILALINLHRKEIVFKWKSMKTELHVPFGNISKIIAFDSEGKKYKLNMFLVPKEIKSDE